MPVRGLQPRDFHVLEDGKPVEIAAFSAVDLPVPPAPTPIPPPDASGTVTGTNDFSEDGRVFLVVLDEFTTRFEAGRIARTKRIARQFVERLASGDLAAVVSTGGRRDASVEFTGDKAKLMAAIDKFLPSGEGRPPPGVAETDFPTAAAGATDSIGRLLTRSSIATLKRTADALADIPHRRKGVVLISEGIPFGIQEAMATPDAAEIMSELRDFMRAVQRANVAVYTFDAGDPADAANGLQSSRKQNMIAIAEGTGGFPTLMTDDAGAAMDRMIAENGAYYMLGYSSPAAPNDGRHHRIEVRVSRPDVRVSAREGYVAERAAKNAAPPAAPLDALIAAPLQTRGLPMRIVATPAPGDTKSNAVIAVAVEIPVAAFPDGADVEMTVAAVSLETFKVRTSRRGETIVPPHARDARAISSVSQLHVPPGRYQVRVAARTADGSRQGSVFAALDVPKYGEDFAVGGLFIAVPDSLAPMAVREFGFEPLKVALPVRVGPRQASGDVKLVAALDGPNGSLQKGELSRPAAPFATAAGIVQTFTIPARTEAGAYRFRVTAACGNLPPVVRELRFTRAQPR